MEISGESKKKYYEIYKTLPEEARGLFWSEEVFVTTEKLKRRYKISENNNLLSRIIALVILGFIPPSKIPETMISEIALNLEDAERLSDDIKKFILFPIKDLLQETYKEPFSVWEYRARDEEMENIKEEIRKEDPYRENL